MESDDYKKFPIGTTKSFTVLFDKKMHNEFSLMTGDDSLIHFDDEFSRKYYFRERLEFGFLVLSHLSKLYGKLLPAGLSVCMQQEVKFIRPIYVNDLITITGRVYKLDEQTGKIYIAAEFTNEKGELCYDAKGIVKLLSAITKGKRGGSRSTTP